MHKVAAFGEVMMRLEAPRYALLEQAGSLRFSFAGSGVNVLSALVRFGHRGRIVTALPDNPLGDAAAAALRRLGLDTACVVRSGRYVGSYFLEHGFGSRPSRVTYADRSSSSFNTAEFDRAWLSGAAGGAQAVHFCGIGLAMNDGVRDAMKHLARTVKQAGGLVVFDCNFRPSLWGEDGYERARPHYAEMLRLSDVVMMNELDARLILGLRTGRQEREAQLLELIPAVAGEYGIRAVAGTHRSILEDHAHMLQGYLYRDRAFYWSRKLRCAVRDRVGAGDAYAAGIVHGLLTEAAAQHTVEFAAAAAMLAHTVEGDAPLATEREVLEAMREGGRDVAR